MLVSNLKICLLSAVVIALANSCEFKTEIIGAKNGVFLNSVEFNSPAKESWQTKSVSFKGISLQTPISAISEIEASEVAANPLEDEKDKPDYVKPRHILLKFGGEYAKQFEESNYSPEIRIYPVEEFRKAFFISKDLTKEFDKEVNLLQSLIAAPEKSRRISEFPFLLFYERTASVNVHRKKQSFKNGQGISYIAQLDIEPSAIENLTYVFQGFTTDKKYYVSAIFPVNSKVLQDYNSKRKFDELKLPTILESATDQAKYKKYLSEVEFLLDNSTAEIFAPNLDEIKKTVSSLEVDWRE